MLPRLLLCLILAGLGAAATAAAAPPARNLRRADLRALVLHDPAVSAANRRLAREGPGMDGGIDRTGVSYGDLTGDGRADVVVPLFSGGTAGDIAYFVYAEVDGRVRDILPVNDVYQVGVRITDHRLVERLPRFRRNDPNCCPSFVTTTVYRWNSGRLVQQSRVTKRARTAGR
jgi:hypothetical protein